MSLKKKFLKSKPLCKVTFNVSKKSAGQAKTIHLVGDFNQWKKTATPMKKLKNGFFTVTVDCNVGHEYQYRFLIDGKNWITDIEADKLVPSPYPDAKNSVVVV